MAHDHHDNPLDFEGLTFREAAAGASAGFAEHIGMFPFDTIKTRMQADGTTIARAAAKLLKTESWKHLYRGCVPVLCSAVPAHGAYFSIYEMMKRRLSQSDETVKVVLSASCATIAHDSVSIPFDTIKQRMQVDAVDKYKTSLHCLRSVVRSEGITSLFVSLPTTVVMNVPHMAAQWLVYERLRLFFTSRGAPEDEHAVHFIFAGLVAGAAAATVSTPLDNIKTRLQLGRHRSALQAAKSILQEGGITGFATGVLPRICHMAPSAAITMATYELVKAVL